MADQATLYRVGMTAATLGLVAGMTESLQRTKPLHGKQHWSYSVIYEL